MNTTTNLSALMATDSMKTRREAQQLLAQEVTALLRHDDVDSLHWQGTRIDLMEALHLAYETGELQDEDGISLPFTVIVSRACRLLHIAQPSNPYECASRGSRRKGRKMVSYLDRYARRLRRQGPGDAFWKDIAKG